MIDGRPQLRRMIRAIERGRPVPDDVVAWFVSGVQAFEAGNDDLAGVLAIRSTRPLRQARNEHLREAGRLIGGDVKATVRATMIRRTASKLEAFLEEPDDIEPFIRHRWEREVFRAIQCADLPKHSTIRQLMP
jgi:hypothetical protein